MPTISVIIPAYNAEKTILETIQSVQQQTFSDFELIIINDGSTDRTLELLNTIQDPRIKTFSCKIKGVSEARNWGISQANGEFIAFLDADDLWTPDKLERQLAALRQNPKAGVAYSWTLFMDEQGEYFHADEPIFFEGNVYGQLLLRNFIASGSNPLIRREALESVGEFDSTLTHCEDWDYWFRLAAHWPFVVVPKPQIFYRQSSSSACSKIEVLEAGALVTLEKAFKSAPSELQGLKNHSLANVYRFSAKLYLTRIPGVDGIKQAGHKLQTTIWLYPKILLEKTTQKLLIKLLLLKLLSPGLARWLLQPASKLRATVMQNHKDEKALSIKQT